MNAQTIFNVKLPELLKNSPDDLRELDAIYVFNVTGDQGGVWTVDLKANPPVIRSGDAGTSECSIEISSEDFETLVADPDQGMQLYFQGRLKVSGNPMLATKLQPLLNFS